MSRPVLRWGFVTTSYPRFVGDWHGVFVAEFATWLAAHGDSVEVCAPFPAMSVDPNVPVNILRYAKEMTLFDQHGAIDTLIGRQPMSLKKRVRAMAEAAAFTYQLRTSLRQLTPRYDVLCSHWLLPCALVANWSMRAMHSRPHHLMIAHGSDVHLLARLPLASQWLNQLCRPNTTLVITSESLRPPLLDCATTPHSRRWIEAAPVIPMGIDREIPHADPTTLTAAQALKSGRKQHLVLFIGRLIPLKGVDILLRACAQQPNCLPVIVGDGPHRAQLEHLARQLKVDAHFVGEQTGAIKQAWLASADLFVLPSRTDESGRTDSAPVVLLEALRQGLPIIASDIAGIGQVIAHRRNGLLVAPGCIESLAEALAALSGQTELPRQLAAAAQRSIEHYVWDVVGAKLKAQMRDRPSVV